MYEYYKLPVCVYDIGCYARIFACFYSILYFLRDLKTSKYCCCLWKWSSCNCAVHDFVDFFCAAICKIIGSNLSVLNCFSTYQNPVCAALNAFVSMSTTRVSMHITCTLCRSWWVLLLHRSNQVLAVMCWTFLKSGGLPHNNCTRKLPCWIRRRSREFWIPGTRTRYDTSKLPWFNHPKHKSILEWYLVVRCRARMRYRIATCEITRIMYCKHQYNTWKEIGSYYIVFRRFSFSVFLSGLSWNA